MAYHPRIETEKYASFLTTRSRNSELWFVNNCELENAILGYAAKFSERYSISLYGIAIEGNHIQAIANFPKLNRSQFMRDFNSCIARAVGRYTPEYPGGRFWARRYSQEFVPGAEDVEAYFFYTVLQPVQDGLVKNIMEYPGYNCFYDAIHGKVRKFKIINWTAYNNARRFNDSVSIEDYVETVDLKFARLPGYEHLSQKEYAKRMHKKLYEKQTAIIDARQGKGFVGREGLAETKRGARPKNSKRSARHTHRPRVLSLSHERRAETKAWYFAIYFAYKTASEKYRAGKLDTLFPTGTYPPMRLPEAIGL